MSNFLYYTYDNIPVRLFINEHDTKNNLFTGEWVYYNTQSSYVFLNYLEYSKIVNTLNINIWGEQDLSIR